MARGKKLRRQQNAGIAATVVHQFSGPIPPPDALERYERLQPGFANRIMTMAEGQAQHRQSLEKAVTTANIRSEARGQVLGFIIAMTVIAISAVILWQGKSIEGLIGMLGTVTVLASVFVYGRWRRDRELRDKERQRGG